MRTKLLSIATCLFLLIAFTLPVQAVSEDNTVTITGYYYLDGVKYDNAHVDGVTHTYEKSNYKRVLYNYCLDDINLNNKEYTFVDSECIADGNKLFTEDK